MIHELLATGEENARSGRELAQALNCDIRIVTIQIARERRAGQPICATSGHNPGYYLAADLEELRRYCERLKRRGQELFTTRQALVKVLKRLQEGKT